MTLTDSQLKLIKDFAREEWLACSDKDSDAHVAKCWLKAINRVLAKDKLELYAFEVDQNKGDPRLIIDPSGKLNW